MGVTPKFGAHWPRPYTAARNRTSGFSEPEVVLREQILVYGQPEVVHGPKFGENHRPEGGSGQTGSRNMAATRFLDSATPTSYSTPNTLWGLTRTVTELPSGNLSIRITVTDTRIFRNSTEFFSNSNKAISFKFS